MNEKIKKYFELAKSPKLLMILGMAGILLIFLSSFIGKEKSSSAPVSADTLSSEEYRVKLEENVKQMVKSITGSDNVTVVITLESGVKYSYADVNEGTAASKTEQNGESTSSETKQTYITVKTADGGEQALIVTEVMPEVRGVAIVCEGGDDESTAEKITGAVTAALNITSKRVYIAGGNSYEKR